MELGHTIKLIMDKIDQEKPARLVIDALTELRLLAEDPFNYRRQILTLKRFFSERDCTVLALDDLTETVPGCTCTASSMVCLDWNNAGWSTARYVGGCRSSSCAASISAAAIMITS